MKFFESEDKIIEFLESKFLFQDVRMEILNIVDKRTINLNLPKLEQIFDKPICLSNYLNNIDVFCKNEY